MTSTAVITARIVPQRVTPKVLRERCTALRQTIGTMPFLALLAAATELVHDAAAGTKDGVLRSWIMNRVRERVNIIVDDDTVRAVLARAKSETKRQEKRDALDSDADHHYQEALASWHALMAEHLQAYSEWESSKPRATSDDRVAKWIERHPGPAAPVQPMKPVHKARDANLSEEDRAMRDAMTQLGNELRALKSRNTQLTLAQSLPQRDHHGEFNEVAVGDAPSSASSNSAEIDARLSSTTASGARQSKALTKELKRQLAARTKSELERVRAREDEQDRLRHLMIENALLWNKWLTHEMEKLGIKDASAPDVATAPAAAPADDTTDSAMYDGNDEKRSTLCE